MTMTTHVGFATLGDGRATPMEALNQLTAYVGGDPGTVIRHEYEYGGNRTIANRVDQGLDALIAVQVGCDGPIVPHEDDPKDTPTLVFEISFDQPYGIKDCSRNAVGFIEHMRLWGLAHRVQETDMFWYAGEFAPSPNARGYWSPIDDLSTHGGAA